MLGDAPLTNRSRARAVGAGVNTRKGGRQANYLSLRPCQTSTRPRRRRSFVAMHNPVPVERLPRWVRPCVCTMARAHSCRCARGPPDFRVTPDFFSPGRCRDSSFRGFAPAQGGAGARARSAIASKPRRAWGQRQREGHGMKLSLTSAAPSRRKQELTVFVVLTLLLAPILAIATVGGYGLGIWIYQMISGPPGPPPKPARAPGIVPQ